MKGEKFGAKGEKFGAKGEKFGAKGEKFGAACPWASKPVDNYGKRL